MRAKTLEVLWHDKQPVYSCDFQPLSLSQLKRMLPFPAPPPSANPPTPTPSHATPSRVSASPRPTTTTSSSSRPPSHSSDVVPSNASPTIANATILPPPPPPPHPHPSTSASPSRSVTPNTSVNSMNGARPSSSSSTGAGSHPAPVTALRGYRLATAGADNHVRIWMIYPNSQSEHMPVVPGVEPVAPHPPNLSYLAGLRRHTAPVNVVRWSPNGQLLASAGDDGVIILWQQTDVPTHHFGEESDENDKEYWKDKRVINKYIIAGSTDNLAQVFSVSDGACVHQIQDHAHFVQGVAWDPLDEFLATQSSDRSVHVHGVSQRNGVLSVHNASTKSGRSASHSSMEIKSSRQASFNMAVGRPSMARRASNVSEAGSAVTLSSEAPHDTAVGSSSMSAMNPPLRPSSRRSSFSKDSIAGSPLLAPVRESSTSSRTARSPSPAPPLPAIRPVPLTAHSISQKLYGDELTTNFFRRLTFSPDGGLLLTPAGQIEEAVWPPAASSVAAASDDETATPSIPNPKPSDSKSTVYIYSRANLHRPPIAHLPGHKTTTIVVRFSPIFYELRQMSGGDVEPKQIILDKSNPNPVQVSLEPAASSSSSKTSSGVFGLPYRLMFAVASQDAVLLYDTQQSGPIAIFKGLHYAAFTDISWSPTGDALFLSSSDGYCSIVVFDASELGALHHIQQHQRQLQNIAQTHAASTSSGNLSLPPSPAPSHVKPVPLNLPSRSDRESSISSLASMSTSAAELPSSSQAGETSESTNNEKRAGESSSSSTDRPAKKRKVALTTTEAESS